MLQKMRVIPMFTGCRLAMLGLAPKQTDMSAKLQGISAALCQGSATAGEERGSSSLNVSKQQAGACRMRRLEESQGVCWQSVYVSRVGHTWLYTSTGVGQVRFLVDRHQREKVLSAWANYMLHLPALPVKSSTEKLTGGGHMSPTVGHIGALSQLIQAYAFSDHAGRVELKRGRAIHAGPGASEKSSRQDYQTC